MIEKAMPKYLLTTERGKINYVLTAYLIGIVISISIGFIVNSIYPHTEKVAVLKFNMVDFIGLVLFAPIVETMLMVPIIALLKLVFSRIYAICATSALIWATIHGLLVPIQAITIFPQFFIFTLAFLVWDKQSRKSAYLVVMSIHMLNNVTVFLIGALSN